MKLGIGKTSFRGSTAAAGFVAGVAVTLMLFAGHQKHRWAVLGDGLGMTPNQLRKCYRNITDSCMVVIMRCSEAHLEASARSLPGQLSENDSSTGSTAQARGSGSVWAQAAAKRPPPLPPIVPPDLDSASRLMVSFGNSAYFELVQNWAHSVMGLQDTPFLIAGKAGREGKRHGRLAACARYPPAQQSLDWAALPPCRSRLLAPAIPVLNHHHTHERKW
jgi:hypothetical protein